MSYKTGTNTHGQGVKPYPGAGVFSDELAAFFGSGEPAPAWVGIDNLSDCNPVVTVSCPKENRFGTDFEAIKKALKEGRVILYLSSPDHTEAIEFWLSEDNVTFHAARVKTRPTGADQ